MSEPERVNWMQVWIGAAAAGGVTFLFLLVAFLATGLDEPDRDLVLLGALLIAFILGWAVLAYRRGNRELAVGLVGGYGLLALVSSGECTMFVADPTGDGAERGFFIYPTLLLASLIVLLIVAVLRRFRVRQKEDG